MIVLRHACGATFTAAEWDAMPVAYRIEDDDGTQIPVRACRCGSHITYGSLAIVGDVVDAAPVAWGAARIGGAWKRYRPRLRVIEGTAEVVS